MSLIFNDFYVPALTPYLNSTETSLQLSRLVQSHVATDGQSVSQSVSLGVEPHLELVSRYLAITI
jgi:ABC-type cobalamin/Fe3+-siderophores transport system ATPase subunit